MGGGGWFGGVVCKVILISSPNIVRVRVGVLTIILDIPYQNETKVKTHPTY